MGGMLKTFQGCYEKIADCSHAGTFAGANSFIDGTLLIDDTYTNMRLYMPPKAKQIDPLANGMELVFKVADGTNNAQFGCIIWGYSADSTTWQTIGAERIADISGVLGNVPSAKDATSGFADTVTILSQSHLTTVTALNDATRLAKLAFDNVGYKYIWTEFYEVTTATGVSPAGDKSIAAYLRYY